MTSERKCFLCGRNGSADPLDLHHLFGGAYRKKSDRLGLVVDLCHHRCHIFGGYSVHQNRKTELQLKRYGQLKAMQEQGWTEDEFRAQFGKSYLEV